MLPLTSNLFLNVIIQEACYFEFQWSVKKWPTSTTYVKYKKGQDRAEIVKVLSTHNWCSFLSNFYDSYLITCDIHN